MVAQPTGTPDSSATFQVRPYGHRDLLAAVQFHSKFSSINLHEFGLKIRILNILSGFTIIHDVSLCNGLKHQPPDLSCKKKNCIFGLYSIVDNENENIVQDRRAVTQVPSKSDIFILFVL